MFYAVNFRTSNHLKGNCKASTPILIFSPLVNPAILRYPSLFPISAHFLA